MPNNPIRLLTRADDAGMCHTANVAIAHTCTHGIVRNVSVMVPAPAFTEASAMFRDLPGIALGLHVTLTAEWGHLRWGPVLPPRNVPSLINRDGHFFHNGQDLHAHGAVLAEMQAEIIAQLGTARDAGLNIAYLDEHMGVGWINGLGEWLHGFCEREGLVCNRGLLASGRLSRLPAPPQHTDDLVADMIARLHAAPPGTYLRVGHPAYVTAEMQPAYLPGQAPGIEGHNRDAQRRMFMDEAVLACVAERAIMTIRYTDIVRET